MRKGGQHAHELCVKQVALDNVVPDHAPAAGVVAQGLQNIAQRCGDRALTLRAVQFHDLQKPVEGIAFVLFLDKAAGCGIVYQGVQPGFHLHSSKSTPPWGRMDNT